MLRRHRFQVALAVLVFMLASCAHGKPAPPRAAQAPATSQKSAPPGLFLYSAQKDGRVSHLLGTIHLGFGFEEVLSPAARTAFERAKLVITETDLGQDPASRLVQAALLPAGQSLRAMLDDATWSTLEARLGAQVPGPLLAQMKPWLPAVLLGIAELKQALDERRPGKSERMMDVELLSLSRSEHKQVAHLESVDEQIGVFEGISLEEQLAELRRALTSEGRAQASALVSAFASGDEGALSDALFDAEQMKSAPGFYQTVLFARNTRWLPVLLPALSQGATFVAVGAAHLLGERGLLRELSRRGFRVERVY